MNSVLFDFHMLYIMWKVFLLWKMCEYLSCTLAIIRKQNNVNSAGHPLCEGIMNTGLMHDIVHVHICMYTTSNKWALSPFPYPIPLSRYLANIMTIFVFWYTEKHEEVELLEAPYRNMKQQPISNYRWSTPLPDWRGVLISGVTGKFTTVVILWSVFVNY